MQAVSLSMQMQKELLLWLQGKLSEVRKVYYRLKKTVLDLRNSGQWG